MCLNTIVVLFMVGMLVPMSAIAESDGLDKTPAAETQTVPGGQQTAATDSTESTTDGHSALVTETPVKEKMPPADSDNETAVKGVDEPATTAGNASEVEPEEEISDPLEPMNRVFFTFNDKLYFWVLKPVSTGYNMVVPEPARVSVRNLYTNASMPIRFVGSLMQGKIVASGTELARFTINTTLGLVGLFDVAEDKFGLKAHKEDLGQTLGSYGIGNGPYLVLPFLGPSTLRDTVGAAGDAMLNPLAYIEPFEALLGVFTYDKVNRVSLSLGEYEDWKKASLDLYTSMKDAYVKRRKVLIKE
jgi:phospholipid-binding lipoprotein MlaA